MIRHHVNVRSINHRLSDENFALEGVATQTVLILQGGGALGAFECGVVKALEEAAIHPDIVAGVSIGAFNGAIIAGNPGKAAAALDAFWNDLAVAMPVRAHRSLAASAGVMVEHLVRRSAFLPAALAAAAGRASMELDEPIRLRAGQNFAGEVC